MSQVVRLGSRRVKFPSPELQRLKSSREAYVTNDYDRLNHNLQEDGYIYLPGVIPEADVMKAREHLLKQFSELDVADTQGTLRKGCDVHCVPFMEGRNRWTDHPSVLQGVLECSALRTLFDGIFGATAVSFEYKWLRAVPSNEFTGVHLDRVYMCRGTERLLTCWIPFGPLPVEMGSLCMLEGSHALPGFNKLQETYGKIDFDASDIAGSGWISTDPAEVSRYGGQWKTENFKAGDIMVFTMRTLHMSATNTTNKVRISCDTRWQPNDEPIDPRYAGVARDEKVVAGGGLYGKASKGEEISMEEKKAEWQLTASEDEVAKMNAIWGVPTTDQSD